MKIYFNGKIVSREDAKVSVFDHGLLYGDGVFEGIRAYKGRVYKLLEHIDRLYKSARAIKLDITLSKKEIKDAVLETLRANHLKDAYIRLVITRGEGDLGLNPLQCPNPCIFIIADKIKLYPRELYDNGLRVIISKVLRNNPLALDPQIKSLNYLNNILAKIEANSKDVLEAIMLTADGYVAECSGDNIFIVKNKELLTPPSSIGALEGITRNTVIDIAAESGYNVHQEKFFKDAVYSADECFLTGTAAEVIPVVVVDDKTVGDGKPGIITRELIEKYSKRTQSEGVEI